MDQGKFTFGKEREWITFLERWARSILTTRRERYDDWKDGFKEYKNKLLWETQY